MQVLECSLSLPSDLDCNRCLTRLQKQLASTQGVISAIVNHANSTLQIAYEASQQSPASLEALTRQVGAEIAGQTEHRMVRLTDLHCPDCATTIEKDISQVSGVFWAEIRFASAQMAIEYDRNRITIEQICDVIKKHGVQAAPTYATARPAGETDSHRSGREFWSHHKTAEIFAVGLLTLLAILPKTAAGHAVDIWLYAAAILIAGRHILLAAWRAIGARTVDMNVLVLVAVIGAVGLQEWLEGTTVLLLFNIGNLLQIGAVERTRRSTRALIEMTPSTVRMLQNGEEIYREIEQIQAGEILRIKPGERIPMDGILVNGETTVDQSPITGESLPVLKHPGDQVFGGTLNGPGAIDLKVTHRCEDMTLARIIHWVEEAQTSRAPAQQFIDRFARVYTPIVVVLALGVAILPPCAHLLMPTLFPLAASGSVSALFALWLSRALAMLLVACPCALVISMPVAIVTAIGSAARNGILIKGGACLEAIGEMRVLLYDKTGTLTQGHCRIETVLPLADMTGDAIMKIALALESRSEHPLAAAFTYAPVCSISLPLAVEEFCAVPGGGIQGRVGGETYLLGNANWLHRSGVDLEATRATLARAEMAGHTVVLLATTEKPLGMIVIGDTPRLAARQTINALTARGIVHQIMLTGDNLCTAQAVGEAVGLTEVHAHLLPEDKLRWVRSFQQKHGIVGMIGDGINDAPALAAADIGIVMGIAGSDTVMETADIALMTDDLNALPYLIDLSRRARSIIRQNVIFALLTKGLLLLTAMVAGIPLWLAVLGDVGVSLTVTLNALRLRDRRMLGDGREI